MTYISHADLGGLPAFGPVTAEPEGELFHSPWEPRAMALTVAMGGTGTWNLDMARAARETLPNYQSLSYYQIWINALQNMLEARGIVHRDELDAGHSLHSAPVPARVLRQADVATVLATGNSTERSTTVAARYRVGQHVRVRAQRVNHHTRLPRYASGKLGTIARVHGMHVFADAHAQGWGEVPRWLYTVVFDGVELWGSGAENGLKVSIDAFEPYLGPR